MFRPENAMTGDRLPDEAVDWFVRLQSDDVSDDDFAAHADWLAADARHQAAYDSLVEKWTQMEVAADFARRRIDERSVAERPSQLRRPVARHRAALLAAAAVVMMAIGAVMWLSPPEPTVYLTRAGEQRSIGLADGSTIHLNTKSEIAVRMTRGTRLVDLRAGEALFEVQRDTNRPFVVDAGAGRVTVVGTTFNIYRTTERTTVTVLDGAVAVSPMPTTGTPATADGVVLTRGRQVAITSRGEVSEVRDVDLAGVTAWRQGRLHFKGVPLTAVAAEIGRYFEERIVVSDDVADLEVIANIKLRDLGSAIGFLEEILPVEVTRVSGDVVRLGPAGKKPVDPP
jgi:transmembrane sensor